MYLIVLQTAFGRGRAASVLGAAARREPIDEETDERKTTPTAAPAPAVTPAPAPAPAPAPPAPAAPSPHDAALAELRRDVRNEVQRLQQKVGRSRVN